MVPGFAFIYMRHDQDAEDAIAALEGKEYGYKRRLLKVEWAKVRRAAAAWGATSSALQGVAP